MYRKDSTGWIKHVDFIILDLICLQVAFVLAYALSGYGANPYQLILYRNMAVFMEVADLVVLFAMGTLKNVLKRGYYKDFVVTAQHGVILGACLLLYLFMLQEGQQYSRLALVLNIIIYMLLTYLVRELWKHLLRKKMEDGENRSLLLVVTADVANVVGSSIAREADSVFYTLAGPEIAVATTKAYSTQLVATYALAIQFAKVREEISEERYVELIKEVKTLPEKIAKILEDKERIQWFASKQVNAHDVFFVGRGIDYAICMEGSLKMKEISYIHSEAYAAGELKHGTISLIEDDILVVGVLTQPELYEKTISNMLECKSRGAYLMGLTTFGKYNIEDTADFTVYIPKTDPLFATSLAVIPLQLLGYYISVAKGLDVDKPRNLAKSVTVE